MCSSNASLWRKKSIKFNKTLQQLISFICFLAICVACRLAISTAPPDGLIIAFEFIQLSLSLVFTPPPLLPLWKQTNKNKKKSNKNLLEFIAQRQTELEYKTTLTSSTAVTIQLLLHTQGVGGLVLPYPLHPFSTLALDRNVATATHTVPPVWPLYTHTQIGVENGRSNVKSIECKARVTKFAELGRNKKKRRSPPFRLV